LKKIKKKINELDKKRVIVGSIIFGLLVLICIFGPFLNNGIPNALWKGTLSLVLVICVMIGGFTLPINLAGGIGSYAVLIVIFIIVLSKSKSVDKTCAKKN